MRAADGTTPNALAISGDSSRLFVAEADANAVAVVEVRASRVIGPIPTEWYPTALTTNGPKLIIVSGKGSGTAPNPGLAHPGTRRESRCTHYTLGQLSGSVMMIASTIRGPELHALTRRVTAANHWNAQRDAAKYPPFRHVLYVIKENRTYDQVFGDLPGGDADPSLTYFPREVSANHHALAELDLRRDAADEDRFNRILWSLIKGELPYPGVTRAPLDGRLR